MKSPSPRKEILKRMQITAGTFCRFVPEFFSQMVDHSDAYDRTMLCSLLLFAPHLRPPYPKSSKSFTRQNDFDIKLVCKFSTPTVDFFSL